MINCEHTQNHEIIYKFCRSLEKGLHINLLTFILLFASTKKVRFTIENKLFLKNQNNYRKEEKEKRRQEKDGRREKKKIK
jgi:hypothetical protein